MEKADVSGGNAVDAGLARAAEEGREVEERGTRLNRSGGT
jgi:hypothetical protein